MKRPTWVHAPASPTVALAVGVLASGAANAQWAYDHGGDHVSYAAGAFATLLAPTAIHLWPRVPLAGELRLPYWKGKHLTLPVWRLIRAQVMTLICAAAAFVNLTHAVEVLTHRGWAWLTAGGLILAVETIVVMASLARRQPETRQTKRAGGGRQPAATGPAGKNEEERANAGPGAKSSRSSSSPPPAPLVATGDIDGRAQQIIAGNPGIGRDKLAAELSCSKHQARVQLDRYKRLRVAS